MIKFYKPGGTCCRYKFGDKVQLHQDALNRTFIVIDAKWIGCKSHGFWELFLEDINIPNNKINIYHTNSLKKVGQILK
jgi:hypothetical protein